MTRSVVLPPWESSTYLPGRIFGRKQYDLWRTTERLKYRIGMALGKIPKYGTQSSSGTTATVTTADSWTNIYTDTVPAGMKRLKKARFILVPDPGLTATSIRQAPAFRLTGSGLLEQNPHNFLGMFGGYAAVTTAGYTQSMMDIEYDVDIPVQVGGSVAAEVNVLREAQTAGSAIANLFYDEQPPKEKNSMADYVEAAGTTTADAWASIATLTVPVGGPGSGPKRIKAVAMGVAPDPGTSAISVRISPRFRLTGSGIAEGGSHDLTGPAGTSAETGTTPSQGVSHDAMTRVVMVDIPVNAAGTILAEHRFEVETPTASSVAVGVLYA